MSMEPPPTTGSGIPDRRGPAGVQGLTFWVTAPGPTGGKSPFAQAAALATPPMVKIVDAFDAEARVAAPRYGFWYGRLSASAARPRSARSRCRSSRRQLAVAASPIWTGLLEELIVAQIGDEILVAGSPQGDLDERALVFDGVDGAAHLVRLRSRRRRRSRGPRDRAGSRR